MQNRYLEHEEIYQTLKVKGYTGWGGSKSESREAGWQVHLDNLLEFMGDKRGRVLELGCGTGIVTRLLAHEGFKVIGVDVSQTAIEWAIEKTDVQECSIEYYCKNVCDEDDTWHETFDIVFDSTCVHCIIGEDRELLFQRAYQMLRTDGIFFINSIIAKECESHAYQVIDRKEISPAKRCLVKQAYLEKELEDCGFKKMKCWVRERDHNDFYSGIFVRTE